MSAERPNARATAVGNCAAGVADDEDLDRMGDTVLLGEVSPRGSGHPIRIASMNGRSRAYTLNSRGAPGKMAAFRDVQIGFIQRERFDQIGEPMQNVANYGRFTPVNIEPGRHHNQLRATLQGHECRHGRADTEFPCLVVARSQNAPAFSRAADANRFAPKCGPVANFDRRVKTIHVEVDNDAGRGLVWHEKNLVGASAIVHRENGNGEKTRGENR